MQCTGSLPKKIRERMFDSGNFRGSAEFMIEAEPGPRPAPQAFLVHQDPDWVLPTHYHLEEQFQVVTGGSGTLGRHALQPLMVHYTSREAAYGPIVAGPQGLDYLTLRSIVDTSGVHYLPEARGRMRLGIQKRQQSAGPVPVSSAADLFLRTRVEVEAMIAADDSGLSACLARLPPGAAWTVPDWPEGGGRFHIVVAGSLLREGDALGRHALVFTSPDEAPLSILAGREGLEMLVLQYPAAALDAEPAML